jgi:hypothetical protein
MEQNFLSFLSSQIIFGDQELQVSIDEPGEQRTVVFALIVTEPNGEFVCTSRFRYNLWKDDSALFSRFLQGSGELGRNQAIPEHEFLKF